MPDKCAQANTGRQILADEVPREKLCIVQSKQLPRCLTQTNTVHQMAPIYNFWLVGPGLFGWSFLCWPLASPRFENLAAPLSFITHTQGALENAVANLLNNGVGLFNQATLRRWHGDTPECHAAVTRACERQLLVMPFPCLCGFTLLHPISLFCMNMFNQKQKHKLVFLFLVFGFHPPPHKKKKTNKQQGTPQNNIF